MLVHVCMYVCVIFGTTAQFFSFAVSVLLGVLFGVIVMLLAIAVAAFVVLYCHYRQLNNKYIIMQETTEEIPL